MSAPKYKDWILETIDQLRKRKARPCSERICHMVSRKHGVSFEETAADLERLVDGEVVIKVDYKGSTSYRNAAKWRKSHLGGHVQNSNDASRKLQNAIRALVPENDGEDGEGKGATIAEIEKWMQSANPNTHLVKNHLLVAIARECEAGRITKLANGGYVKGPPPKASPTNNSASQNNNNKPTSGKSAIQASPAATSAATPAAAVTTTSSTASTGSSAAKATTANTTTTSSTETTTTAVTTTAAAPQPTNVKLPSPSKKGRPATKRKRFKKTHGPDFESYDVLKTEEKCDYCLLTSACNRNGIPEDLLICKDCNAKAHPSCMDYSTDLARRARTSPWQCIDCKTCFVCQDSGEPDSMLFCDACDKGYHMNCHQPPVQDKPTGKWVCSTCRDELGEGDEGDNTPMDTSDPLDNSYRSDGGPSCLPTPCDSPVHSNGEQDVKQNGFFTPNFTEQVLKREAPSPPGVPDASEWSIEDVVAFFSSEGFPDQSEAFREQEIDGKSLLLMRRADVLTGLSLKLGPALKIYKHIERLQTGGEVLL